MGLTIGQGLASFGENMVKGQEARNNLELRKEALKVQQGDLKLRQDMFMQGQMEAKQKRDDLKRSRNIINQFQTAGDSINPMTEEVTREGKEAVGGALGAFAQSQNTNTTPMFENLVEMDFRGAKPERVTTDIKPVTIGDVPEKVRKARDNLFTKTRKGGKVKHAGNQKILDRYLDGITDAISPIVTRKGDRGSDVETEASRKTRTAIRAGLLKQLEAGEQPTESGSFSDRPLGVELLPDQANQPTASEFLSGAEQVSPEGQIPMQSTDIVTEEARQKTDEEFLSELMNQAINIEGMGEMDVNQRNDLIQMQLDKFQTKAKDISRQKKETELQILKDDAILKRTEVENSTKNLPDLKRRQAIRKEFNALPIMRTFYKGLAGYTTTKRLLSGANPSAADDMAGIYAYMKLADPESTVLAGEFANAQDATGIPQRVLNLFNKAVSGVMLNPQQRLEFIRASETTLRGRIESTGHVVNQFMDLESEGNFKKGSIIPGTINDMFTDPDSFFANPTPDMSNLTSTVGGEPVTVLSIEPI